jgi:hypothetical protein
MIFELQAAQKVVLNIPFFTNKKARQAKLITCRAGF